MLDHRPRTLAQRHEAAAQVHPHHPIPFLRAQVEDRAHATDAGVDDRDVERAQVVDRVANTRDELRLVTDVASKRHVRTRRVVQVEDGNPRAHALQMRHGCRADAARATGHDRSRTPQIHEGETLASDPMSDPWFGIYLPQLRMSFDRIARTHARGGSGRLRLGVADGSLRRAGAPEVDTFEGWTIASALAARTSTIRVGHLVLCDPFRHPALLAKMAPRST